MPECPYCGYNRSYKLARRGRFCCANSRCRRQFSETTHTSLRCHKKPMEWYERILALRNEGKNAHEIAAQLGNPRNTYKSVWEFIRRHEAANAKT